MTYSGNFVISTHRRASKISAQIYFTGGLSLPGGRDEDHKAQARAHRNCVSCSRIRL